MASSEQSTGWVKREAEAEQARVSALNAQRGASVGGWGKGRGSGSSWFSLKGGALSLPSLRESIDTRLEAVHTEMRARRQHLASRMHAPSFGFMKRG